MPLASPNGPRPPANLSGSIGRRGVLACSVIALLAVLVYLNALHSPFIYDDYRTIVTNGSIGSVWQLAAIIAHDISRPIVNFSYAFDHQVWGDDPFGFHLTNLLLHVLNVVLLFRVAWRWTSDLERRDERQTVRMSPMVAACTSAALFAVHPLMTEAVGYISGRSELLCAAFFLSAALCARRWMLHDGVKWWTLTVILWIAAILSKEVAAMFPIVMMGYGLFVLGGTPQERRARLWKLHAPLLGVATSAAIARVVLFGLVEHPGGLEMPWRFTLSELFVVARYAGMIVIPRGQAVFHDIAPVQSPFDPAALVGVAVLAVLLAIIVSLRVRLPIVGLGVLWFLALLVPSSVLAVVNQGELMAEHRVYLASCGLFLASGAVLGWLGEQLSLSARALRWAAGAAFVLEIVSLGGATAARNAVWSDPVALWREASVHAPNNWFPRAALGEAFHGAGRHQEATIAYQTAIRMRPTDPFTYFKLGLCYAELGRFKEAAVTFDRLRQQDPMSTLVPTGLGIVAMMAGNPDLARRDFQAAILQNPREIMARQWQAVLEEVVARNPAEALRLCEEIHQLAPGTLGDDDCIARNRAQIASKNGGH